MQHNLEQEVSLVTIYKLASRQETIALDSCKEIGSILYDLESSLVNDCLLDYSITIDGMSFPFKSIAYK